MSKETIEPDQLKPAKTAKNTNSGRARSLSDRQVRVVGIGASAGGLESIERFFENIDETSGAAFIVIQHLSPDFKSFMPEILSKKTQLQVLTVTDQMPVHPNIVYLMPPRVNLVIEDGVLYLNDIERTAFPNKPIDLFFESLAADQGSNAVAVVLSGTGSDGSAGILKVNEAHGKVFVESPASAKFDGMPSSALSHHVHDGMGTPFEIAGQIFGKSVVDRKSSTIVLETELQGDAERVKIFKAIEHRYGVDFSRYKISTVNRRIDRRIMELSLRDIGEYWNYIQQNEGEVTSLYYEMLIGVTKFFRDPEAFELLSGDIKQVIAHKEQGDEVRVWSAGCASGEEAYTLAMLFLEEIKRSGKALHLKVFATDIDDEVLGRASIGTFRRDQMADVPESYIVKYFRQKNERYRANANLRSQVVFARHNIMNDPPFAKLDLIACRNLLIYLDNDTQRRVLSLFYFSLVPGGTLFLGPSESLGKYESGYETTNSKWKIFKKVDHNLPVSSKFQPGSKREQRFPRIIEPAPSGMASASIPARLASDNAYKALLEQYVPSGLLIDVAQDLLHVFGEPPFTLQFKQGRLSANIRSFLDERLCTAISVCAKRALQERTPVEYSNFLLKNEDGELSVDFKVTPIASGSDGHVTYFLITFGEQQPGKPIDLASPVLMESTTELERVSMLEEELKNTKQHLQTTIEELESTNEELQSTNEELLASNEELQSANEELHSVNEELYTVNAEYQSKITELNQLSMDEEHLFRSTGVGTIFIDQDLCIRKYTPTAAELFNLLSQDQGRPFDHVTHLFEGVNFNQLVEQCIQTQNTIETEVTTRAGEPHIVKIVPYRNDRDEADGAVVSFVSTQAVKHAEQLYRDMFQSSPVGIIGLTPDKAIVSINPSLRAMLGFMDDELLGQPLTRLFPASKEHQANQVIDSYVKGDSSTASYEHVASSVMHRDGSEVPVEISVNSVPTPSGTLIHLYVTNMTDRQQYLLAVESHRDQLEALVAKRTAELEQRNEEYEDLYENAPDMYASISAADATIQKCNNRLAERTGYSKEELLGRKLLDLYHPDCHPEAHAAFQQFLETGWVASRQLLLKTRNGERIPVLLNADAVRDEQGAILQSRSTFVDISDVYALRSENRTFLLATQGSDIGIWDWDFKTGEQHWSDKFHELLGYPAERERNLSFDDKYIVHAHDREALTTLFKRHFAGECEFDTEVRLHTASDDYRWFRLQGKAVRSEAGKVVRMVGSAQDINDARVAQDELKRQTEVYRFITEETNDGWFDWQLKSDYEYMSPRFWHTFGVDPATKSHSPSEWKERIHPDDLNLVLENFDRHSESRGEHPYLQEVRYRHEDGHWSTVICRGRIVEWDDEGEPVRMVGVHTDVTKLKNQEKQLKEINAQLAKSNEDLEKFAYITSHDLKAPLRGITTLVGFMEEDLEGVLDQSSPEAESIYNNLSRLQRQATRMEGLISGVLDYSRVDSAGATVEDVDTRELLLDLAVDHYLDVGESLMLPDDLPMLRTDAIMFEQVIGNLISNAVKFHPRRESLRIVIGCERKEEMYEFRVTDNGPGIDPNFHERIFDMFQTLQSKDTYESTGIGLTLVKRIVEKYGGEVWVESEEGSGASFVFTWPARVKRPVI